MQREATAGSCTGAVHGASVLTYLLISNWKPPLPAEVHTFTAALGLGILISQAHNGLGIYWRHLALPSQATSNPSRNFKVAIYFPLSLNLADGSQIPSHASVWTLCSFAVCWRLG
ncbi:hypothetical protein MVEN_00670300 [Mycena venus]|uniref:Uncharacterized protein n=1 Tax=Mycena venus TaxID=2733690 RepID=A0A8H7D8B3_9AGAR|nr:hypothetical protein MVEN_00670300 [Mycena venus]